LKKNKSGNKRSKINSKPFPILFSVFLFTLFFMLATLPGCRLIFFPRVTSAENNNNPKNSKVWEESVSSMNATLKQFAAVSASRWAGLLNADKIEEAMALEGSAEPYLIPTLNKYDSAPDVLGLTESGGGICSAALYSFYDNIAEQLRLFKNKTGQPEIETQKVAAAAGETVKKQEAGAGQAESQESAAQDQQNQQADGQAADGQQTGTPDQTQDFAAVLLSLINNTRLSSGLPLLSINSILGSIAKSRCDDMIARDYFSHVSPEGKDIQFFIEESGMFYKMTGENLQYCSPPSIASPELFFNSWMESNTHRANILDSGYTQIGIALSFNSDKAIAALVFLG
jgi:uncharacterized protein YkwD